ncbi:complement factor H like 4 [Solea solea]|uniref:complement factor H like 4 n=1 Tax=Solea solea TaxID=90069 RepID=UPI00272AAD67|nr:complement factor H like 4 [Solea solea]
MKIKMRTITRSCVLFLWMQALTFVKSQDCTLEEFVNGPMYDSNFDITGLDAIYPGGKQVSVSCNVGYSGFFKLLCVEGKWQSRGTRCQPKSCGHPGDTAFADFNLEIGEDFVFGSKVVYKCHTGYQMVSRTNHRHCMAGGWDGVVPICEAQQCSVIHVDDNVQVTGDLEEATFGNVVRFSCKNRNEVLIGSQEIYCNEHGEWSDDKPKCEELKCFVPVIQNGFVKGDVTVYKEQEVLRYQCNPDYKIAVIGHTKCIKQGLRAQWSPTPACELITCKLSMLTLRGTSYEPAKSVFSRRERVRVTCDEDYWIPRHQQTTVEATCKDNGEWTIYPVCQVFTCTVQDSLERYWRYSRAPKKIGDSLSYTCKDGYKSTDGNNWATCTRAGWRPDPQCQGITCNRNDIENTNIVNSKETYVYKERVDYVCTNGYEGKFSLTCGENGWSGNKNCREKTCKKLNLNQAHLVIDSSKRTYKHGDQVQYECHNDMDKRFTVVCEAGVWTGIQLCTGSTECPEAEIQHGFATGAENDTLYYTCDEGYKLITKGWWGEAKCVGGVWSGLGQCIETRHCEVPVIPNGDIVSSQQKYYEDGKHVQIVCNTGYSIQVQSLTCVEGKWPLGAIPMKNICALIANQCSPPPKVDNAVIMASYQKEYLSGSQVIYQCRPGHNIQGEATLTCKDGKWDERTIECKRTYEEPVLKLSQSVLGYAQCVPVCFAVRHVASMQPCAVQSPWAVLTQCSLWTAAGIHTDIFCFVREKQFVISSFFLLLAKMRLPLLLLLLQLWSNVKFSSAQKVCPNLPDVPHAHVSENTRSDEYQQGHVIHFTCETGYISGPTIKYMCSTDGWIALNRATCYLKPCQLPDDTPNGHYQIISGGDFVFGATIKYFCNEGYQMVSREDTRTCLLDKWTNHVPICEALSCRPPHAGKEITVTGLPDNDEPILPDRFLTFSCDSPGKYLNGSSVLVCGKDGNWSNPFPTCEDRSTGIQPSVHIQPAVVGTQLKPGPQGCERPIAPANAELRHIPKDSYRNKERVEFMCPNFYLMEGGPFKTCDNGEWVGEMRCLRPCTVNAEDRNRRNLRFKYKRDEKLYSTHNDEIEFSCTRGRPVGGVSMRQRCRDGVMNLPSCHVRYSAQPFFHKPKHELVFDAFAWSLSQNVPQGCERPTAPADAELRHTAKDSYHHKERVEFMCPNFYLMEGGPFKTCDNGEWVGEMRCLRPCTMNTEDRNRRNIRFKYMRGDKLYSTHNDEIEFSCTRGKPVGGVSMRQRCRDGVMNLPSCH